MIVHRALLLLGLAFAVGGAAGSGATAGGPSGCRDAALVSLRTGAVLKRYTARDGGVVRSQAATTVLPGEDAVADGHGGWYVAGAGLAHLLSDGRVDTTWHPRLHRRLRLWTLARAGNSLYVSDGHVVFAVDARSGALRWSKSVGRNPAAVMALAATRSAVYIGGRFSRVGNETRHQLAALDPATGRLLAWRTPSLGLYSSSAPAVGTLALGSQRLYFSGGFIRVDGVARRAGVAAVSLPDGRLTPFDPGHAYAPLGLAVWRGHVLIGGDGGGGMYDARTGHHRRDLDPLSSASVITVHGSIAYVGGNFRTTIGGQNLLAVNLRTGELRRWFPNLAHEVGVATIAISGEEAFVGGQFCPHL